MDVQLQELIDKIKRDGVASAETAAQKIISDAEAKAATIVKEAEEKADGILKSAKAETERMEKASEDAITQAGRNLIISFRDGINKELSALVTAETEKALDKDVLKKLVPETVKAWAENPDASDISVLLSPKDLKALDAGLRTALKAQISKGLEIKADATLSSGFRIGMKNGSAFYDFSADEVAALFSAYLNPRTAQLMKNAAEGIPPEQLDDIPDDEEEADDAVEEEVSAKKPRARSTAAKKPASTRGKK